ncbi:MAG TPA: hypothetical protein VJG48_00350 [Candidatus Paceibacterota bacterium]
MRNGPDSGCTSAQSRFPGLHKQEGLVVERGEEKYTLLPGTKGLEVRDGAWLVGRFYHDPVDGFTVSLGMESQLHDSDGTFITSGWNGDEHNTRTLFYGLRDGMNIRYHQIFDHKPATCQQYEVRGIQTLEV